MTQISKKKTWVAHGGYRGQEQYINAVAGANDTGTWSDSPCPSDVRKKEIDAFGYKLRRAGIPYRTAWAKTSNVFCVSQQVLVADKDKEKALEIATEHVQETRLFYTIKNN